MPRGSIVWEGHEATLADGWTLEGTAIRSTREEIDPRATSEATFSFELDHPGAYTIQAEVRAPYLGANSVFVTVDEPLAVKHTWHIPITDQEFATRTATWGPPSDPGPPAATRPSRVGLTSSPPTLHNPKKIVITNANPSYFGSGVEDIIVTIAEKMTVPVKLANVRNIVLIGGEFTITKPLVADLPTGSRPTISKHRALGISGVSGGVWIEGIWINNSGGGLSEGIQTWDIGGTVYLSNSRIEGVRTKPNDPDFAFNHPDLIQAMGGSLVLENVTLADSDFQGVLVKQEPGQSIPSARFRNVNTRSIARQAWFFHSLRENVVEACENCWHDLTGNNRPHEPHYSFYPHPTQRGSRMVWEDSPQLAPGTSVSLGTPPEGDFAPVELVGMNYQPGQFGSIANSPLPPGTTPAIVALDAGPHVLRIGAREANVTIARIWLEPVTTGGEQVASIAALSGEVSPPFIVRNGRVGQLVETLNPQAGGSLRIPFTVPSDGIYMLRITGQSVSTASNSVFIDINSEPQEAAIWDIAVGPTVTSHLVSWRGRGTYEESEYSPKLWLLTAGSHTLIIRGREARTWIEHVTVERLPGSLIRLGDSAEADGPNR